VDGPGPLVDWIAAHPDNASVLLDDGRGRTLEHLADRQRPIGSASKAVHLTAYARAVVAGRLDPAAPVPVADWERWYVPGNDGGAHLAALQALDAQPEGAVRWDDLVTAMIDLSDNAAPDLIRATLGDAALVDAAACAGWAAPDLPSFSGEALLSPGPISDWARRREAALAAAATYANDPAARSAAARRAAGRKARQTAAQSDPAAAQAQLDELHAQAGWFDGGPTGSVSQLAGLYRAGATGGLGPEASTIVRRHLERAQAHRLPAGVVGIGEKNGLLPGLMTNAVTARRADGTVGVSVISLSGMQVQPWFEAVDSGALIHLSRQALFDGAVADRLAAATGSR
jgi:hypothetical protein